LLDTAFTRSELLYIVGVEETPKLHTGPMVRFWLEGRIERSDPSR
jgi:hypothetical protein